MMSVVLSIAVASKVFFHVHKCISIWNIVKTVIVYLFFIWPFNKDDSVLNFNPIPVNRELFSRVKFNTIKKRITELIAPQFLKLRCVIDTFNLVI